MKDLSQKINFDSVSYILPELPYEAWKDTYSTLHMWTQIVGKIKLALMPMQNHWWHVSLFVNPSGITTSSVPYGKNIFEIKFDFINHKLIILVNDGRMESIGLYPRTVADFYNELMNKLHSLNINVKIWTTPVEVEERIPFDEDTKHSSYDTDYVHKFWLTLIHADKLLSEFKAKFSCKTSPINFFWGSFDIAFSIYSGKPAPEYKGIVQNVSRYVMKEAMSMEELACGFWPGAGFGQPAYYAYAYPEPQGFKEYKIKPDSAQFNNTFGEFILPYNVVRSSPDPDHTVHEFLWSVYEAAAITANWNRETLEYKPAFQKSNIL